MRALRARVAAGKIISTLLENHVVEIVQNVEIRKSESLPLPRSQGFSGQSKPSLSIAQGSLAQSNLSSSLNRSSLAKSLPSSSLQSLAQFKPSESMQLEM